MRLTQFAALALTLGLVAAVAGDEAGKRCCPWECWDCPDSIVPCCPGCGPIGGSTCAKSVLLANNAGTYKAQTSDVSDGWWLWRPPCCQKAKWLKVSLANIGSDTVWKVIAADCSTVQESGTGPGTTPSMPNAEYELHVYADADASCASVTFALSDCK